MKKIIIDGIEYGLTPSQPQNNKERIEVMGFHKYGGGISNVNGRTFNEYRFHTWDDIPEEKHSAIKQAIEQVLNE
jgi:hypothetical protein